jgi:1,4-dihydroxy-2-naphthoate octaprenyltransferase
VGYTKRGAETASRIGLPRATARGWLTIAAVNRAVVVVVIATMLVGLPIVLHGGWPVLLMGVTSIIAAWAYMGGPRPIAYTPFGELTVFVFFGLIAAVGSYYIQTGTLAPSAWLAAGRSGWRSRRRASYSPRRSAGSSGSAAGSRRRARGTR